MIKLTREESSAWLSCLSVDWLCKSILFFEMQHIILPNYKGISSIKMFPFFPIKKSPKCFLVNLKTRVLLGM